MAIYTREGDPTCYTGGEASISDKWLYAIVFGQLTRHTILRLEPSIKKRILFRHVIIRRSSTTAPQNGVISLQATRQAQTNHFSVG
jgi:hypothetical protein